jgi:hypothetical protein
MKGDFFTPIVGGCLAVRERVKDALRVQNTYRMDNLEDQGKRVPRLKNAEEWERLNDVYMQGHSTLLGAFKGLRGGANNIISYRIFSRGRDLRQVKSMLSSPLGQYFESVLWVSTLGQYFGSVL